MKCAIFVFFVTFVVFFVVGFFVCSCFYLVCTQRSLEAVFLITAMERVHMNEIKKAILFKLLFLFFFFFFVSLVFSVCLVFFFYSIFFISSRSPLHIFFSHCKSIIFPFCFV